VNYRRILALSLIAVAVIALVHTPVQAQCSMCVTALENSPQGKGMAASFNRGIVFLLFVPYAIFATVGIVVFRAYRRKRIEARRDNPYIPRSSARALPIEARSSPLRWLRRRWVAR
jgi:hypothetical protein